MQVTPGPIEKLLYSRKDAAQALSISIRSLDYLIERGDFSTKRIGKKVLIPAAELRRFAKGRSPGTITSYHLIMSVAYFVGSKTWLFCRHE